MKLSIITINYNHLEGLKRTADSVLAQTWTDFEWIIVDGGSNDGSKECIEDLAGRLQTIGVNSCSAPWNVEHFSKLDFTAERWIQEHGKNWIDDESPLPPSDKRRLLWCSERDKGIYNAMNKGIVEARGEYCLFLNSGDWLESPSTLKDVFKNEIVHDIVCGKIQRIIEGKNVETFKVAYKQNISAFDLMCYTLPHQSCFIKRNLFAIVGFYDESLKIVADWKFFVLALLYRDCSYKFIDVLVANQEPGGVSDEGHDIEERQIVSKTFFPFAIREDILLAHSTRLIRKNAFLRVLYSIMIRIATKWHE